MVCAIRSIFFILALAKQSAAQAVDGTTVCPVDSEDCHAPQGDLAEAEDESVFLQTRQKIRTRALSSDEGDDDDDDDGDCDGDCRRPGRLSDIRREIALMLKTERAKLGQQAKSFNVQIFPRSNSGGSTRLLEDAKMDTSGNLTARAPCTSSEKNEFLEVTNKYRCMHGAPTVTWSDLLASELSAYLDTQTSLVHDPTIYNTNAAQGKPCGENLFGGSKKYPPSAAVDAWYSEVNDCQGGPTGFSDGCFAGQGGKPTGHFTVLVWNSVQEIGCAYSADGKLNGCRYRSGDGLNYDTPNMMPASNYASHVLVRSKAESQCGADAASSGNQATPAPTAAPTPEPTQSESCVQHTGCVFKTVNCGMSLVNFHFNCADMYTMGVTLPDNYQFNLGPYCANKCGAPELGAR